MINIFYVIINNEGKFYNSELSWIPEGEELYIYSVENLNDAKRFFSIKEIENLKKDIENSRELYKGKYIICTGEFEMFKILKIKETVKFENIENITM